MTSKPIRHRALKAAIAVVLLMVVSGVAVWANWSRIAVRVAPKKQAAKTRSEAAMKADELFWQTFHNGEYEKIQPALDVLTAAYLQTPNDAVTAAHIAWLHTWRISEQARKDTLAATITDDIVLGRRYFQEAVKLD